MFFPRRQEPLVLAEEALEGLRLSLNSPVINLPDLPVGPARAAIAVYRKADGRPGVTVCVRSQKRGEVALFSFAGEIEGGDTVQAGAEAALSFGESMGFLFDEDELGETATHDRGRALGLWSALAESGPAMPQDSGVGGPTDTPSDGPIDIRQAADELLLEDLAPAAVLDSAGPSTALAVAPVALTKFRQRLGRPADAAAGLAPALLPAEPLLSLDEPVGVGALESLDPAAAEVAAAPALAPKRRRTALGRLKLVKRRLGSRDDGRRSWVTRLLTSF